jgi:hypothetical protein
MRLCEKLVRNPALSPSERARLLQAQRVVADEVAAYYYLGTDQEYWSLTRDFPNLAPPFESFFIECRAPEAIVSRETGITRWTPEMGYEWGHLCLATSRRQRIEALCEEEGRQRLWQETHDERERLLVTLRDWQSNVLPQEGRHPLQDQSGFSPSLVQTYVERARRLLDALGAGRRDEAQRVLESDPWEWSLELLTYVNFSRRERHLTGPLWWTRLRILPTGEVATDVQGGAIWEDEPLGWVNQSLQLLRRREGFAAYARAVQEARLSIAPLIDTALLTICFLHCRNVALQEVRPPRKPLSNQQRRRGERPRAPLSYHVLGAGGTRGCAPGSAYLPGPFRSLRGAGPVRQVQRHVLAASACSWERRAGPTQRLSPEPARPGPARAPQTWKGAPPMKTPSNERAKGPQTLLTRVQRGYPMATVRLLEASPTRVVFQLDQFTISVTEQGLIEVAAPTNLHQRVEQMAREIEQVLALSEQEERA